MHAPEVLLVILSVFLAIFLVVAITLIVILIKVLNNVRRVTQRVDETTENMGEMLKYAGRKVGPAALTAIGSILWRTAKSSVSRKDKRK